MDDERSFHDILREKFNLIENNNIISFYDSKSFKEWHKAGDRRGFVFLIDYHLNHDDGIRVIDELDIQNQSILVTSNFDEEKIIHFCMDNNVKLIPKEEISSLPVEDISNKEILYLDDEYAHLKVWELEALGRGLNFAGFSEDNKFVKKVQEGRGQLVFIDQNLGEGKKGSEIALQIAKLGVETQGLVTGYDHLPHNQKNLKILRKGWPVREI